MLQIVSVAEISSVCPLEVVLMGRTRYARIGCKSEAGHRDRQSGWVVDRRLILSGAGHCNGHCCRSRCKEWILKKVPTPAAFNDFARRCFMLEHVFNPPLFFLRANEFYNGGAGTKSSRSHLCTVCIF